MERYLYDVTYHLLIDVVEEQAAGIPVRQEDKAFIADFYKYAFVGLLLDWIDHQLHSKGVGDVLGQFNIRAHILLVSLAHLLQVDELIRGVVRAGDKDQLAGGLISLPTKWTSAGQYFSKSSYLSFM